MEEKEIESDRKVVRNFTAWLGHAGKKYITGLPCRYSIREICESMRNLVRHDTVSSKSLDKIRRTLG